MTKVSIPSGMKDACFRKSGVQDPPTTCPFTAVTSCTSVSFCFSKLPKRVKSFFTDGVSPWCCPAHLVIALMFLLHPWRIYSLLPLDLLQSLESLRAQEEARSKRHSTSELGTITFSDIRKEGWLHYKQILTEKGKVEHCREHALCMDVNDS